MHDLTPCTTRRLPLSKYMVRCSEEEMSVIAQQLNSDAQPTSELELREMSSK